MLDENDTITVTLPEAMTVVASAPKVVTTKGPPALPWMRSPVEIAIHDPLSVDEVPLLDSRLADCKRLCERLELKLYFLFRLLCGTKCWALAGVSGICACALLQAVEKLFHSLYQLSNCFQQESYADFELWWCFQQETLLFR